MTLSAAVDFVGREMEAIFEEDPGHPIIAAVGAYVPNEEDELLESILETVMQNNDSVTTSFLHFSPLSRDVRVLGVDMLVAIAFQASKERCVKDAPDDYDWKTRFLKYADVDLKTANQMGRKVCLDVQRWDAIKDDIMYNLLKKSISHDDEAKTRLMQAPDNITEDLLPDPYWGLPGNNVGVLLKKLKIEFAEPTNKLECVAESTSKKKRRRELN